MRMMRPSTGSDLTFGETAISKRKPLSLACSGKAI
jgi:hypothetical protein